jgi:hypothetical protein
MWEPDKSPTSERVPKVGMTFKSEDYGYDFYNNYAKKLGSV